MPHIGLAELLGVKGKSIQWERPLLFFAALIVSDLVWLVLANFVFNWQGTARNLHDLWTDPDLSELRHLLSSMVADAGQWVMAFLDVALLVALAMVALRLIPWAAAAVAATVLVNAPLHAMLRLFLAPKLTQFELPAGVWKTVLAAEALWVCCLFAGLALGLRWIRPVWLALLVGATAGILVSDCTFAVIRWMSSKEASFDIKGLALTPVESVVLGAALWAGLWLSSDPPAAAGEAQPRLRKGFYLGTLAAAVGLLLLCVVVPYVMVSTEAWRQLRDLIPALILIGMGLVLATYANVVWFVLIHRMWAAIQDGHARTSPGRAVGFLFIPFYNLYWLFQALAGFAKDFNAFGRRHSIKARPLSPGLFVACGILLILAAVPVLDIFLLPALSVVALVMVPRICDAVNSVPRILPAAASTLGA
jgi:hypothetical protein